MIIIIKILLLVCGILFFVCILISNFVIRTERLCLFTSKVSRKYKILHFADLHLQYDCWNSIRNVLEKEKIDLIVINGDILKDRINYRKIRKLENFLEKLKLFGVEIVFIMGNHELEHVDNENYINSIMAKLKIRILRSGEVLTKDKIMFTTYDFVYRITEEEKHKQLEKINELQKEKQMYKILLSHSSPHNELKNGTLNKGSVDLTLSGHTHGGIFTFPIFGPIKLPDEPINENRKYSSGLHNIHGTLMNITRGAGHGEYYFIRGILNLREISVIEINSEKESININ
ncbi:MAG: metallophosphoesterase [Clostridia bacterium]|nr:metallophosphoesterase [Clostridia bacterium]MDD4387028.1 metallophosphoesterase [Clostridia bacterium]